MTYARNPTAPVTLANGRPAHTAGRLFIRQSAINAGDPDALARLYELTGHGPISLVINNEPDLRAKAQAGMGSRHD